MNRLPIETMYPPEDQKIWSDAINHINKYVELSLKNFIEIHILVEIPSRMQDDLVRLIREHGYNYSVGGGTLRYFLPWEFTAMIFVRGPELSRSEKFKLFLNRNLLKMKIFLGR